MEEPCAVRIRECAKFSDSVLPLVLDYIDDPSDHRAVSLVCRRWYQVDGENRKHVTIELCYSTSPQHLRRRFTLLQSLKLKGKPRAFIFKLISENWGGYVKPWVEDIGQSFCFLKYLHFVRMFVNDTDLRILAQSRGANLLTLKIEKCCGFSTDGLLLIAQFCRSLTTFSLKMSEIMEIDGGWLHELALNNSVMERLDFFSTQLALIKIEDLELIALNCPNLLSLKISGSDMEDLVDFFRLAKCLKEFDGGYFKASDDCLEKYSGLSLPHNIYELGVPFIKGYELRIIYPLGGSLKKLDLFFALLNTEEHCLLIRNCPNLEFLKVKDKTGDKVLEVVAQNCKKLRGIWVDNNEKDEGPGVTEIGIMVLVENCIWLEEVCLYVTSINNEALGKIGAHSSRLQNFQLTCWHRFAFRTSDIPLDNGIRALLSGCPGIRRLALFLEPVFLSNAGLDYIGRYGSNLRWLTLISVGGSDAGLLKMSRGCPRLQKLELGSCYFSDRALATAVTQLISLRYLWVEGYIISDFHRPNFMAMVRPFWNIELLHSSRKYMRGSEEVVARLEHVFAYYSLVGRRVDMPLCIDAYPPL